MSLSGSRRNDPFSEERRRVSVGPAPPRGGAAPPPALKMLPACRELTPQPKPGAGRHGRCCLGTPEPRTPPGRPARPARLLPPPPPPPGECLPGRGAAGGDRGRHGAGCATRRSRARTPPRSRAHALRTDTRPPAPHDHPGRPGPRAGGPHAPPARARLAPSYGSPGQPHGRARVQGSPAGSRQGCE